MDVRVGVRAPPLQLSVFAFCHNHRTSASSIHKANEMPIQSYKSFRDHPVQSNELQLAWRACL